MKELRLQVLDQLALRKIREYAKFSIVDYRISATELARKLGDILGRIRYRGDTFTVDRNGTPVARIGPVSGAGVRSLREATAAWMSARADESFADDLERIRAADRPPANPWDS